MATSEAGANGPDRDEVFDLLSNHRRRYTLHYCKQAEEPVTTSDLAETVAAWELDKEVNELSSDERKRVYTSLQQTHLPTLADAGMITYEDHEVELTDDARKLEVYMDIVPEGEIPWGIYYLGLSAVGFAVLGGVWADILPSDGVSAIGWAGIVVGLFAVSAAAHTYTSRRHRLGDRERPP
ncbi:hypothetical protein L593_08115 [Salinarchaeum sp. Harcht-Bsk1]|uniref:DUF7344 domain-containing protein n=1 Tax=Salinarchaeum sp. Harcht-Bsk1 TaxID=1333523 RepID=UPI00034227EE|nr:hypothetical protein [Salinarchaeum sp. Harcht-Bsk1]AGN01568.1 hypothetical protein L593_08115 [Salinarchaeum sp. Harcht-Bsk1]